MARFAGASGKSISDGCLYFSAKVPTDFTKWRILATFSEKGTLSYQ